MSDCELCDGTLQIDTGRACGDGDRCWPNGRCGVCAPLPCPRCLSTPATPELLNGWCGPVLVDTDDDLDALVLGVHLGEPLSPRGAMVWHDDGGVGSQRHPVEQIYLDADIPEVRDRLARALAQRYGLECGATAPMWRPWNNHPELLTWNLHNSRVGIAFDPAEVSVLSCPVVRVPTLATIPADAPPMLRAARALVLCWEAALHSGA